MVGHFSMLFDSWHAKEGNEKWVSLLLWAGADPTTPGPCDSFDDDEELYETAIELAFSRNHPHLFKLKPKSGGSGECIMKSNIATSPTHHSGLRFQILEGSKGVVGEILKS